MRRFVVYLSVGVGAFVVSLVAVMLFPLPFGASGEGAVKRAVSLSSIRELEPDSPIRSIDFDNDVAYPHHPEYGDCRGKGKVVDLRPGEGGPSELAFGDVTGDGAEEAMAFLGINNCGSAVPGHVYVFTLRGGRLKLLWDFLTGDRADGGFKKAYAESGELVIELEGRNKYIGGDLYAEDETKKGDCCPTMYTRARYKWNGRRFEMQGRPESFPCIIPNN
ncbi:MAG: hypothetical protein JO360_09550 [Acidobacteria bacterium]|nr:hypothetical protein [Acidobacteriota bacterium]